MTAAELMAGAETAYDLPLGFDGCPCFRWRTDDLEAYGHCWRTSYYDPVTKVRCNHEYVGVHVWGSAADAARLAFLLTEMNWYGEWDYTVEGPFTPGVQHDVED